MNRADRIDEVVSFSGRIVRETEKAVLFELHEKKKEVWFPFSQVKALHHTYSLVKDTLDSIVVTKWIAQTKEII